ncbi:MAG: ribonuclease P protein component [Dehalococcoidia bacterium]|nr:ribonuclease P protein component [Dehalococcoidia bacterium]MSQ17433.1 ribonuclease P protein component [Dehalococcoidia bacterium]
MQRRLRLSGKKRFSQIHQQGQSAAEHLLVVRVLPNGVQHCRFGFVVSRRIGGATVRNKVKRRLREAIRQAPIKGGWDIVFIARRGVEKAHYWQLKRMTERLLRRTHLVNEINPRDSAPVNGVSDR